MNPSPRSGEIIDAGARRIRELHERTRETLQGRDTTEGRKAGRPRVPSFTPPTMLWRFQADTSPVFAVFNRETSRLSRQRLSSSNCVPTSSVRGTCEKSSSVCSSTLCLPPTRHGGSSLSVPNKALQRTGLPPQSGGRAAAERWRSAAHDG